LQDNQVAVFQYDGTESRWRIVSSSGATGAIESTNIVTRNHTGDGVTTTFALGATPTGEGVVLVFQDGVFQNNTEWTLSGSDLTFSTAPATGVLIETRTCDVLAIGTPSDNTVSTAKIQDGAVTTDKIDFTGFPSFTFKNAVMNGAFEIWQRGTSFAAIGVGAYSADRWGYTKTGAMVHTVSRSTDVPTVAECGSLTPYSLLVDCTTVDTSLASGDYCALFQQIEGYVWRRFAQRALTLSFWVKATKTGTYCVQIGNGVDRSFVREYTVDVANTWEKKTVAFPASPSAGTWNYTTGIGGSLTFCLAAGSTFQTTAGAWQTGTFFGTANQVNACDDTANDFRLARVQLEVGSAATEFEDVPYDVELSRCFRYYEVMTIGQIYFDAYLAASAAQWLHFQYKTRKRVSGGASIAGLTWPTTTNLAGGFPLMSNQDVDGFTIRVEAVALGRCLAFSNGENPVINAEL